MDALESARKWVALHDFESDLEDDIDPDNYDHAMRLLQALVTLLDEKA